jgi:cyclase
MISKRIIACLDVRDGCVVKGVQFEDLARAGDPAALARRYNVEGSTNW